MLPIRIRGFYACSLYTTDLRADFARPRESVAGACAVSARFILQRRYEPRTAPAQITTGTILSQDYFEGTLQGNTTAYLPPIGANCLSGDTLWFKPTATNGHSYTLTVASGANAQCTGSTAPWACCTGSTTGTCSAATLANTTNGNVLIPVPTGASGGVNNLDNIETYNSVPTTAQWELKTQETNPAAVVATAGGGTGTGSALTGLVRGGNPFAAAELSGDGTTSGSNALTITEAGGGTGNFAAGTFTLNGASAGAAGTIASTSSTNGSVNFLNVQNTSTGTSAQSRFTVENNAGHNAHMECYGSNYTGFSDYCGVESTAGSGFYFGVDSSGGPMLFYTNDESINSFDWEIGSDSDSANTGGGLFSYGATGGDPGFGGINASGAIERNGAKIAYESVCHGNDPAVAASTTNYSCCGHTASSGAVSTETNCQQNYPAACTISHLYVNFATTSASSHETVFTVDKNTSGQTLTCTPTGAATSCNDTSHSFTVAAGSDLVSLKIANPASANSTGVINWSYQEVCN